MHYEGAATLKHWVDQTNITQAILNQRERGNTRENGALANTGRSDNEDAGSLHNIFLFCLLLHFICPTNFFPSLLIVIQEMLILTIATSINYLTWKLHSMSLARRKTILPIPGNCEYNSILLLDETYIDTTNPQIITLIYIKGKNINITYLIEFANPKLTIIMKISLCTSSSASISCDQPMSLTQNQGIS